MSKPNWTRYWMILRHSMRRQFCGRPVAERNQIEASYVRYENQPSYTTFMGKYVWSCRSQPMRIARLISMSCWLLYYACLDTSYFHIAQIYTTYQYVWYKIINFLLLLCLFLSVIRFLKLGQPGLSSSFEFVSVHVRPLRLLALRLQVQVCSGPPVSPPCRYHGGIILCSFSSFGYITIL